MSVQKVVFHNYYMLAYVQVPSIEADSFFERAYYLLRSTIQDVHPFENARGFLAPSFEKMTRIKREKCKKEKKTFGIFAPFSEEGIPVLDWWPELKKKKKRAEKKQK